MQENIPHLKKEYHHEGNSDAYFRSSSKLTDDKIEHIVLAKFQFYNPAITVETNLHEYFSYEEIINIKNDIFKCLKQGFNINANITPSASHGIMELPSETVMDIVKELIFARDNPQESKMRKR